MANSSDNGRMREEFQLYCETLLKTHLPQVNADSPEAIEATNALRTRLEAIARSYLRRMRTRDPESDAEDAAQDVLAKMPRIVETWRRKQTPFAQVVAVTLLNVCRDIRRRERSGFFRVDEIDVAAKGTPVVETVLKQEGSEKLWAALKSLDVIDRVAMLLKHAYEWSAKDIGHLLDQKPGAVIRRNFKNRPKMRDHLRGRDGYWDDFRSR